MEDAILNGKKFLKGDLMQALPSFSIPEGAELQFIVNPDARVLGEYNDHLVYIVDGIIYASLRPRRYAFGDPVNKPIWLNLIEVLKLPEVLNGRVLTVRQRIEMAKTRHSMHYHRWRSLESSVERKLL